MREITKPETLRPWVYQLLQILGIPAAQADSMAEAEIQAAIDAGIDVSRDTDTLIERIAELESQLEKVSAYDKAEAKARKAGLTPAEIAALKGSR